MSPGVLANRVRSFWDLCPAPIHSVGSTRFRSPLTGRGYAILHPTPRTEGPPHGHLHTRHPGTSALKTANQQTWTLGAGPCTILVGGLDLREGLTPAPKPRWPWPRPPPRAPRQGKHLCMDSGSFLLRNYLILTWVQASCHLRPKKSLTTAVLQAAGRSRQPRFPEFKQG